MSTDYKNLILQTIKKSDNIFDEIGRTFPKTQENIVIEGLGYTSFHIASAIILLTDNGFNQEATILLRSLIENTVNLKWILQDKENRIQLYFHDITGKGFGSSWANRNLKERLTEVGFPKEYYDKVVKVTYSFSHTNAESLDWSNIQKDYPLLSKDSILVVTYQMLGHIIQVLEKNISPKFDFAKEIFSHIKSAEETKDFSS
jgi:hypothetical protein